MKKKRLRSRSCMCSNWSIKKEANRIVQRGARDRTKNATKRSVTSLVNDDRLSRSWQRWPSPRGNPTTCRGGKRKRRRSCTIPILLLSGVWWTDLKVGRGAELLLFPSFPSAVVVRHSRRQDPCSMLGDVLQVALVHVSLLLSSGRQRHQSIDLLRRTIASSFTAAGTTEVPKVSQRSTGIGMRRA